MQLKEYVLNPKILIDWMLLKLGVYVYVGLFFIIFAETGLAFGFFLPGDSLLVVAGLFAAAGKLNLTVLLISLFVAAVIGDTVGYYSGRKMGRAVHKTEIAFFNPGISPKQSLSETRRKNDILARFVPIIGH